jgi:hypothetical protein
MGSELIKISFIVVLATLSVTAVPQAHADIYRCTDEYGNVAYLQLPCPAKKVQEPEVPEPVAADAPEPEPEPPTAAARAPSSRLEGELLENCKKRYRDQIDEIDAEIPSNNTPEQGRAYKERLLALTRQLRACG